MPASFDVLLAAADLPEIPLSEAVAFSSIGVRQIAVPANTLFAQEPAASDAIMIVFLYHCLFFFYGLLILLPFLACSFCSLMAAITALVPALANVCAHVSPIPAAESRYHYHFSLHCFHCIYF